MSLHRIRSELRLYLRQIGLNEADRYLTLLMVGVTI